MITITARTKSEFQEALGPGRGAILIAWALPDGQYILDGQEMDREELDKRAEGADRLIICEGWLDWNKPPEQPKNHYWKDGVLYLGSWLYPPSGENEND